MAPDALDAAVQLAGRIVVGGAPGETIRDTRTRYGFTQEWLAPHLGVRRESLSRIESGHSKPTLDVVDRFSRIMALTQAVRDAAARLERAGTSPNYLYFRTLGKDLTLPSDTVDEIARAALDSYTAKRQALLEGLK